VVPAPRLDVSTWSPVKNRAVPKSITTSCEEEEEDDEDDDEEEEEEEEEGEAYKPQPNFTKQKVTSNENKQETVASSTEKLSQINSDNILKQIKDSTENQQKEIIIIMPNKTSDCDDNVKNLTKAFSALEIVQETANTSIFHQKPPGSFSHAWIQRVVKEWDILKKSLPNGIFLRCYESRIDIIKLLMIGTTGTPYCDLIFGFDIMATSDYPSIPPLIRHLSFIPEKMHPNLLENGSLCLSLLGTWSGKGSENWDPARSNILQLIVSIQGLLLGTPEPYYLEAGYEKQRGTAHGARSSRLYNESAYLLTIQSMIIAQNLPHEYKIFEPIIKMHYN